MRKASTASTAFPMFVLFVGTAAAQEVTVDSVRRLSLDPQPFPLVESFLAINPTDSTNFLSSAMSVGADESVVYASWDGGASWHPVNGPQENVFPGGDPMVAFDGNGRAYFATITPFQVWRSDDSGRSWSGPAVLTAGTGYDREWVAAPRTSSPHTLPVLGAAKSRQVLGTEEQDVLVTAVSRDGGATFAERTMPVDSGYLQTVTDLLVRRNRSAVLPFLVNYERVEGDREVYRGRRWVITSRDTGRTWSTPHPVAENRQYGNTEGDIAMKGLGGGDLAVDESGGAFDGNLYLVWSAIMDDRLQIVLARSTDAGLTWDEPVRVNDGGFHSNHSVPMVAVNRFGMVVVTWNDRRDDPSDACFRHYVAASDDGGSTFGLNRAVARAPTCPGPGGRWLNGGDTNGLVALPDGGFRVTWTAGDGRDLEVWTAVLRVR